MCPDQWAGGKIPSAIADLIRRSAVVLWDFDGVVANTEPIQGFSFDVILRSKGKQPDSDFFQDYIGMPERDIWRALCKTFALDDSIDDLAAERSVAYLTFAESCLRPAPYVRPISAAAAEHEIPNVIVSSGSYRNINHLLHHWHIEDAFSGVLCNGSPESEGLTDKRQRLESALARHSGPALLIEDSATYIDWAGRRGLRTIGVRHELNDLSNVIPDVVLTLDKIELPDRGI